VREGSWDYLYEPDAKTVLDELLVRYLETFVYQAAADNIASEQSARMVAMKSASDNALNIIEELQLIYNKSRQASITKETLGDRGRRSGGLAAVTHPGNANRFRTRPCHKLTAPSSRPSARSSTSSSRAMPCEDLRCAGP